MRLIVVPKLKVAFYIILPNENTCKTSKIRIDKRNLMIK